MAMARGGVEVFAVEDTTAQLVWRDLPDGDLRFTIRHRNGHLCGPDRTASTGGRPGGLVLGDLPPGQDLEVEARLEGPQPDRFTVAVRTLDALPGAELSRVATISDLHLGTEVFGHFGTITEQAGHDEAHPVRCATAALDDAIGWGAQHIVAKGDLTNGGQVAEWRRYRALVDIVPVAVDAIPGNHDRAFRTAGAGLLPEDAAQAFGLSIATPLMVRDLDGLRIVLVDSTSGGRHLGRIHHLQDEIGQAVTEVDRDCTVLVVLHHQLQPHRLAEGWPIGVPHQESLDLLAHLGRTGRRVMVTSGHTHRHRRWSHAGVTATQVGATKDYPGVWAGYVVHEGGMRQVVRRIDRPDCLTWTDHSRRAALGAWRWIAPGRLDWRCFNLAWPTFQARTRTSD